MARGKPRRSPRREAQKKTREGHTAKRRSTARKKREGGTSK